MALAFVDPISAARAARQEKLAADMRSPDPVTRYKAREAYLSSGAESLGGALVAEARAREKAFQRQQAEFDRRERQNPKYQPLGPGDTIIK